MHTHSFVERHGGIVTLPDVEGDVVAADGDGIGADVLVESFADVSAADVLIYADVVDVQGFYVLQEAVVAHLCDLAEGVSEDVAAIVKDEDGCVVFVDDGCELLRVVFGGVPPEQVGADGVMHRIYLI